MSHYILNPGDYQDVWVFTYGPEAKTALLDCAPGARLYHCFRQGDRPNGRFCWEEYTPSFGWNTANRDNLPIKVLEAGEK